MATTGDTVQVVSHGSNYKAFVVAIAGDHLLVSPLVKSGLGDTSPGKSVQLIPASVATEV